MANRATITFVKKLVEQGLVKPVKPESISAFRKFDFEHSKYNQFGLYQDDLFRETPLVQEALKRIPKDVFHERTFRFTRALLASAKKEVLPKEDWTTLENDQRYLSPFIEQVQNEEKEKKMWQNETVEI